eukprot:CAMPEP_0206514964 /NCGR_PEP_ID=MMETSP0324_2-20121206/62460_1 /ASSEMBLY_ACC=CAM_ASM_000836 /TAXON_ID=2866 /ORGANISM="Crypthecodinium cohnii, Strain Seligo" /LENGTH=144 /DNA_ID=CAMNT_0054007557 /DNA_START=360 /DNA_END=790 /DNA_ORIENTATION=-
MTSEDIQVVQLLLLLQPAREAESSSPMPPTVKLPTPPEPPTVPPPCPIPLMFPALPLPDDPPEPLLPKAAAVAQQQSYLAVGIGVSLSHLQVSGSYLSIVEMGPRPSKPPIMYKCPPNGATQQLDRTVGMSGNLSHLPLAGSYR